MKKSSWIRCLAWCLAALALPAMAGEIIIYEHANYVGQRLVLKSPAPNFVNLGFNDRASSIVVTSGRWELCTDIDFQGQCVVFTRGNYPTLDRSLNDRFSSARDLDELPAARPQPVRRSGAIELYEKTRFRGRMQAFFASVTNLADWNFDDSASSLVVTDGTWELCADPTFRGQCATFPPGRYPELPSGLLQEGSSLRLLDGRGMARPTPMPTPVAPPPPAPSLIELFAQPNFGGPSVRIDDDVENLRDRDFNDRAQSIIVHAGRWELCVDSRYRGQCTVYGPGSYARLGEMNATLSSARRVD